MSISESSQPSRQQSNRPNSRNVSAGSTEHHPSERAAATYRKVVSLLEANRAQDALQAVRTHAGADPSLKNLFGICLMRAGSAAEAVRVYRQLVISSNGVTIRPEAPTVFKTNFATALLLDGKVAGARGVLQEAADDSHPAVARLRAAISRWSSGLSVWQRILCGCGLDPGRPVELDFPPGDFE